MAAKALRLIEGATHGSTVTLLMARTSVRYWESAVDTATDELIACAGQDRLGLKAARARLFRVAEQLEFARARRERLQAEADGERWLHVADARDEALRWCWEGGDLG